MTTPATDLTDLPHVVDVPTAGRAFGIGRDSSYRLARSGRFPVPVLRLGRRYVVTRASLLAVLDPGAVLTAAANPQVTGVASDAQSHPAPS